jgi:hypothetical protein
MRQPFKIHGSKRKGLAVQARVGPPLSNFPKLVHLELSNLGKFKAGNGETNPVSG